MATQFNLRYDRSQDPTERWTAAVIGIQVQAQTASANIFELEDSSNPRIGYTTAHGLPRWYTTVSEITTQVPANLAAFLEENPCWSIDFVELVKGAGVADNTAAYQGEYFGHRRFPGCRAWVDNKTSEKVGPHQSITIHAPLALLAAYNSAIRSRKIRPALPYEALPSWWKRLLGLR